MISFSSSSPRRVLVAAGLCLVFLTARSSQAAVVSWGNTATDFNDGASWVGGVAPVAGGTGSFIGAEVTNPNLSASLSIGTLTFDTGGYTLSGTPGAVLTLTSASVIAGTNTSGTTTISADIILGGAGNMSMNQTGGTLVLSGNISQAVGSTGILKLGKPSGGASTFVLAGNNTYANGTTLTNSSETLVLNSNTAIGTGALTMSANALVLDNTSGSAVTLTNNNALNLGYTTAGSASVNNLTYQGARDLNFGTGNVTFTAATAKSIAVTGAGVLTLGGNIGENGVTTTVLFKNGTGTLVLSGSSTYSGSTTITAGTLLVNNTQGSATSAGAVSVSGAAGTATLGGTGFIQGALTVGNAAGSADSLLTAGATTASNSIGKLSLGSNLTLASDSNVVMDLAGAGRGTGYDAFDVGGSMIYGGKLTLNITSAIAAGTYDLFAITGGESGDLSSVVFSGGAYSSTWSLASGVWSSTSGATTFAFMENTGDLVIAVPEPSTWALLGSGMVLVLYRARRRVLRV